jgi:hypothetical protein
MQNPKTDIRNIDTFLMLFIFLLLFLLPLIFTRNSDGVAWPSVIKIWQDRILLIPLFALNHWLLVPKLMLKKKYSSYLPAVLSLILLVTVTYYLYDRPQSSPIENRPAGRENNPQRMTDRAPSVPSDRHPKPVPPYADLLLFSMLIVAVDTGLSFTRQWHSTEEEKVRLEKENIEAQLGMLRNQISPHFFMNTLNNIYSLIDSDKEGSKQAVMKLSKLMRYLLYENADGTVLLSKEFEFIRSYVDLMKIRYVDDIEIILEFPKVYDDVKIPVLLFVTFLENAFKYGTSYERKSSITASFEIEGKYLAFECRNSKNSFSVNYPAGGIGLQNSRQRLDLLYKDKYSLEVQDTENDYLLKLKIPVE